MPLRPALRQLVPYRPQKPVRQLQEELSLERIVKLASNEGAFGPLPAAVAAFEAAVADLSRYPDGGLGLPTPWTASGRSSTPTSRRRMPREEGVAVRALDGFGAPEAIRVTAGTDEENAIFAAALARITS